MRKAIFAVALLLLVGTLVSAEEKIVAGFIYVGPIGDLNQTVGLAHLSQGRPEGGDQVVGQLANEADRIAQQNRAPTR